VARSLETQKSKGIKLKNMLFDIEQMGKTRIGPDVPYAQRMEMVKKILGHLPGDTFHGPEEARTPEEALKLWKKIQSGKSVHREGLVIHPPIGKPSKIKLFEDADVHIHSFAPGKGRLAGKGIGAIRYSHEPGGPVAGEVGTGLSDQLRREMHEDPAAFIGRVAKVRSQGKYPSGALRAPALLKLHSLHEDYPSAPVKKAFDGQLEGQVQHTTSLHGVLPKPIPLADPTREADILKACLEPPDAEAFHLPPEEHPTRSPYSGRT
jgi:hypothetical protein